ncbi:MFS transporter [Agromyces sp. Marseille-P2726]|uniref:MFS transporter n=1 Tax=Agromyces sp. Marseille-P2726 TaxID=2709132 RepID=UPI0020C33DED|nr:MFS transporter [Agromyces sp. Marseille-P2726]
MSVTEPARLRGPRLPWPALIVLAAAVFLSITVEMMPTGLLPEMSEGLGVAEPLVGLLVSVFAFTVVITSTPLTALTARMPRHALLVAVLAVLGVTTLASAVVPEYWMLIAIRIVGGLAHGVFWAIVAAYASRLVPRDQIGRAVSVTLAGGTLALVAGVPATTVFGQAVGWRWAFAIVGALTLAGAGLVWRLLPPVAVTAERTVARLRRGDVSLGPVLVVCAVTAAVMLGQYAVFTFVAPIITDVVGLPPTAVGPLLFVYGATGAIGLVVAGSRLGRNPIRALVVAMVIAAVALAVLGAAPGAAGSIAAFAVWGLAFGAIPPLLQIRLLQAAPPAHRDAASALYTTGFNIGIGGGALVGALAYEWIGVQSLPFAYAAVLALVAVALARPAFGVAAAPTQPRTSPATASTGSVQTQSV